MASLNNRARDGFRYSKIDHSLNKEPRTVARKLVGVSSSLSGFI